MSVVMMLDQVGWYGSGDLRESDNITLVPLPANCPNSPPVERVWLYLKERFLFHRLHADYDALVDPACGAWNRLKNEVGRIKVAMLVPVDITGQA